MSWHFGPLNYGRSARVRHALPFLPGFYATLFAATRARVLVDTSKTAAWSERRRSDGADWRAARPCSVLITRDGRGTLASWQRKHPASEAAELVARWAGNVRDVAAAHASFDPACRIQVRYEDLVADPSGTLEPVCEMLELDFTPEMIEYWRHDHHVVAGNFGTLSLVARWRREHGLPVRDGLDVARDQSIYREQGLAIFDDQRWRTELAPEALAAFEASAGELNRSLGYD